MDQSAGSSSEPRQAHRLVRARPSPATPYDRLARQRYIVYPLALFWFGGFQVEAQEPIWWLGVAISAWIVILEAVCFGRHEQEQHPQPTDFLQRLLLTTCLLPLVGIAVIPVLAFGVHLYEKLWQPLTPQTEETGAVLADTWGGGYSPWWWAECDPASIGVFLGLATITCYLTARIPDQHRQWQQPMLCMFAACLVPFL